MDIGITPDQSRNGQPEKVVEVKFIQPNGFYRSVTMTYEELRDLQIQIQKFLDKKGMP